MNVENISNYIDNHWIMNVFKMQSKVMIKIMYVFY